MKQGEVAVAPLHRGTPVIGLNKERPGKLKLSGPFEFRKMAHLMRRMGLKGATRGKAAHHDQ